MDWVLHTITGTLSWGELIVGLTSIYGLGVSLLLMVDYLLNIRALHTEKIDGRLYTAALVGFRNSLSLAIVNVLFSIFAAISALTPPSAPERQKTVIVDLLLFEGALLVLAVISTLNLRARWTLRYSRPVPTSTEEEHLDPQKF